MSRAALAALVLALPGCGAAASSAPPGAAGPVGRAAAAPPRPVLLVSGKDDHGLPAQAHVALTADPVFGARATTEVDDGTLVRVLEARGEWHRVAPLERTGQSGWIHDFSLRGSVHVRALDGCRVPLSPAPGVPGDDGLPDSAQAEMLGAARRRGALWIRIRGLAGARPAGWVRRDVLDELPARRRCGGAPTPGVR